MWFKTGIGAIWEQRDIWSVAVGSPQRSRALADGERNNSMANEKQLSRRDVIHGPVAPWPHWPQIFSSLEGLAFSLCTCFNQLAGKDTKVLKSVFLKHDEAPVALGPVTSVAADAITNLSLNQQHESQDDETQQWSSADTKGDTNALLHSQVTYANVNFLPICTYWEKYLNEMFSEP
ncbi:hypothetical protein K1T71_010025 [Dendrolimus kikuchii]|uniref:Uncharacterized protein n=1 Tax=Dendrolimus kikuchii TaxID=765133 RepID=A0ACC1CQH4_9NEOP|nr:hypothetical protein K1T71_010025 [Dendrolimus kikuchii]